MAQPGERMLALMGDADAVEECCKTAVEAFSSVHRVVATRVRDHAEATLHSVEDGAAARQSYAFIPRTWPRAMGMAHSDEAVLAYGTLASVGAPNALTTAILTIGDTPPPGRAHHLPPRRERQDRRRGGRHDLRHRGHRAQRVHTRRLGDETPRALAGQPGNRVLASSDAGQEPSALDAALAAAATAVGTVQWVVVSRVGERLEASLVPGGHGEQGRCAGRQCPPAGPQGKGRVGRQ